MTYSNHLVTKEYRQLLRRNETPAERMLWKHLRGKQMEGCRFRQQHGFGPYVLDFYCPALRLCIEVDGEVHNQDEQRQKDEDRTVFLNQNRIVVIRFRNEEIENNMSDVLDKIKTVIHGLVGAPVQTPNPLT